MRLCRPARRWTRGCPRRTDDAEDVRVDHARRPQAGRSRWPCWCCCAGSRCCSGFVNKDRCTGPRSTSGAAASPDYDKRNKQEVCYSDIQHLWIGRDIDRHVFPYVDGGINDEGVLVGGVVEYPVLTGVLIWAGAFFARHRRGSSCCSRRCCWSPFGLATAWLLGKLSRWRALLWAIGPPLVLYAFHNWDLPVVLCAVAAVYVVHRGWSEGADCVDRATVAAVLLGLGFAFKVYPAIFVLPLMLYVLTGGRGGRELPAGRRVRLVGALPRRRRGGGHRGAGERAVRAGRLRGLAGVVHVPAAAPGGHHHELDLVLGPAAGFDSDDDACRRSSAVLSPTDRCWCRSWWPARWAGGGYQHEGTYPWVPVSAAMLCGFLLLHKVHSPQYTLWLVPMFVLLRVRLSWAFAYFVADLAMGIGIFRWYYEIEFGQHGGIYDGFAAQAVMIGVWGRAALLVGAVLRLPQGAGRDVWP